MDLVLNAPEYLDVQRVLSLDDVQKSSFHTVICLATVVKICRGHLYIHMYIQMWDFCVRSSI